MGRKTCLRGGGKGGRKELTLAFKKRVGALGTLWNKRIEGPFRGTNDPLKPLHCHPPNFGLFINILGALANFHHDPRYFCELNIVVLEREGGRLLLLER